MVGRPDRQLRRRAARPAARVDSTTRCATSTRLTSSRSSTAAPASKRLISSRSASSVSNRSSSVCSSSAARAVAGSKSPAGVVQHVAGHPHGRQRGPQLVGDVGDEPALHPGELLELADLALQVGGHLVERRRQPGDVVLAGDVHPLLEPAGREPLGDPAGEPHRRDHLAGDQPASPRRPAPAAARPAVSSTRVHQRQRLLLLLASGTGSRARRCRRRRAARPASRPRSPARVLTTVAVVVGGADPGVGPGRLVPLVSTKCSSSRSGTLAEVEVRAGLACRRRRSARPPPTGRPGDHDARSRG